MLMPHLCQKSVALNLRELRFSEESQDEKLCFSDMETNTLRIFDSCFFCCKFGLK